LAISAFIWWKIDSWELTPLFTGKVFHF